MCLAYPARVVEIEQEVSPRLGTVDFGGVRTQICLDWLPETRVGDYVIVHVGFAISRLDEEDAWRTLNLLTEAERMGTTDAVR